MATKRGERQIYGFPCSLLSAEGICHVPELQQRGFLVPGAGQQQHFPLTQVLWSRDAISFPQLPSQAVTHVLKTPLQNQSSVLLSAHRLSNLKPLGTNCLQNPESLGSSSCSQALLELMAFCHCFYYCCQYYF